MWEPIPVNGLVGRVTAVAVPGDDAIFLVWTDRGLFALDLERKRKAGRWAPPRTAWHGYDPATGILTFFDRHYGPVRGECGAAGHLSARATRTEHPSGQRLDPDPAGSRLLVRDAAGEVVQVIADFPAGSAAWAAAEFSGCGRFLVVASPGSVRAFRFAPTAGRAIPAWGTAGGARDQASLLAAIRAAPDDDLPRLVYADWLDEHGDPARAEFIRLQCRLAARERTEAVPDGPDAARAGELADRHGGRWHAELASPRGVRWSGFRRGFPGVWSMTATTLARAWPRVRAEAPAEMAYVISLDAAGARRLADSPALADLRDLEFGLSAGGAEPYRTLVASPHAANLRRLAVGTDSADRVIEAVAASPHMARLVWLDLSTGAEITDRAGRALLESPHLVSLRGVGWPRVMAGVFAPATRRGLRKRFPGMAL